MMKKYLLLISAIVILGIGIFLFMGVGSQSTNGYETDEEIRKKLNCDRVTTDVRGTD